MVTCNYLSKGIDSLFFQIIKYKRFFYRVWVILLLLQHNPQFMIQTGKYAIVKCVEKNVNGWLMADDSGNEVLLPVREITHELDNQKEHEVFVYDGKDGEPLATLETAYAEVNQVAYLQVVDTAPFGVFMDWGIPKDLLVPNREQENEMVVDGWYLVYLFTDKVTGKITASTKITKFLSSDISEVNEGDEVDLTICDETKLGINVVVNHQYDGLLYHNEIFSDLHLGDRVKGFVKKKREDGKLDISLTQNAHLHINADAQKILDQLVEKNGFLPYHDKSEPEEIYNTFEMSKKSFKRAIGSLYKNKQIAIKEDGIHLLTNNPPKKEKAPSRWSFRKED